MKYFPIPKKLAVWCILNYIHLLLVAWVLSGCAPKYYATDKRYVLECLERMNEKIGQRDGYLKALADSGKVEVSTEVASTTCFSWVSSTRTWVWTDSCSKEFVLMKDGRVMWREIK